MVRNITLKNNWHPQTQKFTCESSLKAEPGKEEKTQKYLLAKHMKSLC